MDVKNGNNTGQWFGSAAGADVFTVGTLKRASVILPLNAAYDSFWIYNRELSISELLTLQETNPTSPINPILYADYYNFTDATTNNTLLIYANSQNLSATNSTLITCNTFFENNALTFQANDSVTLNVWTNLGKPVYTNGVWNSQNYTTTLLLDASSAGEIRWPSDNNITTYTDVHCNVSPSNFTLPYGGNQTFTFNAPQGYSFNVLIDGVHMGQISNYTFTNVTEPHTIQVISNKLTYPITVLVDEHSIISPKSVIITYGESQSFSISADSGYQVSHVYIDGVDKGKMPATLSPMYRVTTRYL